MELDQEGAGQPNVVTNTRSVDFDDDDDFATPQPMTKRSAPILIIRTSTATKETITKTKRRLNVEDMGQEVLEKTKGKKLRIINKNPKFGLVDKENDEGQLGDVDAKERNKKKTKTFKEPNEDKWDGKVGKAGKVNVTEKFIIRNSPNTLTYMDVYNVLGLPNGDKIFILVTEDKALERHNLWKEEFGKNNITTSAVAERIKESQEADDQFKLSFLMVLSNILIENQTGSYVHMDILGFDIQLDDCNQYNWGEFLLRCLVKTKANWRKTTRSHFYTGPIIFLIELLKQRQNYEKQCGNFEENLIIRQQAEIDQIMKDDHGVEESNTSHEDHQNNAGHVKLVYKKTMDH
ncbi:hypothetical protein POM88_008269 [Heracleum sosnowskyi]|uniref:DUF1985 domain-containing protein n=1 Tax=Heracleum sosnowskyi TaxID=360622 RepID=A0AAD8J721_9APIA|nr:hypothetical protein POM88_008269 [Heracleum sosnowskyi]